MAQQLAFMPTRYHDMSNLFPQHITTSRSLDEKLMSHQYSFENYQPANNYLGFTNHANNTNLQSWQSHDLQPMNYSPDEQRQQQQQQEQHYRQQEQPNSSSMLAGYHTGSLPSSQITLHHQRPQPPTLFGQHSPTQFHHSPASEYMLGSPPQHIHHHSMPTQSPVLNQHSSEQSERSSRERDPGSAPNLVGHQGMPEPAPRPRGPKLKFTPADDALLVELKEEKGLTWKQIADFFPGRTSGTLQVRYCTKLKAKTTVWTDEMVQRLKNAMAEYEHDRWRIIASKVGNGFSAAACHDRAEEFEMEETGDLSMADFEQEDDESE